jgi:hypothetical protein
MAHAYPFDELMPLSCKGRARKAGGEDEDYHVSWLVMSSF